METHNLNLKTQNYNLKLKTDTMIRTYKFALKIINFIDSLPKSFKFYVFSFKLTSIRTQ